MVDSGIDSGVEKYPAAASSTASTSGLPWHQRHADSDDESTRLKDMDFEGDVSQLIPSNGNTAPGPSKSKQPTTLQGGQPQQHQQQQQHHRRRGSAAETTSTAASAVLSSCKAMQRKLEMKVDRSRNILTQHQRPLRSELSQESKTPQKTIMPIARMRIPGQPDCLPLVDYEDDATGEHSDDDVEFYPIRKTSNVKHELSDTFSLQEMTIVGTDDDEDDDSTRVDTRTGVIFDEDDEDDDDSQTLEFLTPKRMAGQGLRERCSQLFCCSKKPRL